jgi:hypothetical protein
MEAKHTPTPWRVVNSTLIKDELMPFDRDEGETALIATAGGHTTARAEANAAFIVRACNAHDKLIEALELAESVMSFSRGDSYERECTQGDYNRFQSIYRDFFPAQDTGPSFADVNRLPWGAEKRAPCPHCGKKYGVVTGLKAHIKAKHSELVTGSAA